jgi:DNA-binding transcriptional LysR family regulator
MEINNLKAFIQVAESGSFSEAAEQLFLTQPAVSKRISALESELNVRLFDRVSRKATLTNAGRALLPRAEKLIIEISDLKRVVTNHSGEVSGQLAMGTSHHIGLHRLPDILKQYSVDYPKVELDIQFLDSENACAAVEQGKLELAIITLPNELPSKLQQIEFWQDSLHVVVASDHPLTQQNRVGMEQLLQHPAVLPGRGTYTREILEQAVSNINGKIHCGLSTNYLETLKTMCGIGLGWSLLPESMLDSDGLVSLEIEGISLLRHLGAVTHCQRTLSNAGSAMLNSCIKTTQYQ